jgi:hypothetical protein
MKTKIFLTFIVAVFTLVSFYQCDKKQDVVVPEKVYSPSELIQMKKLGENVSAKMVIDTRQALMDNMIASDMFGAFGAANGGAQDTTGVNAIFQMWELGGSQTFFNVWSKLKVFTGSATPDIYSFCFIMRGSPNLTLSPSRIIIQPTQNSIDFPPVGAGHNSVLTNPANGCLYFVFFDLQPFSMTYADQVICNIEWKKQGAGPYWVTIDRSDPNNFALSTDGYVDYIPYFFPDTLYAN